MDEVKMNKKANELLNEFNNVVSFYDYDEDEIEDEIEDEGIRSKIFGDIKYNKDKCYNVNLNMKYNDSTYNVCGFITIYPHHLNPVLSIYDENNMYIDRVDFIICYYESENDILEFIFQNSTEKIDKFMENTN